jgi:NAD dependent epimerase/dehydratase family enzyme
MVKLLFGEMAMLLLEGVMTSNETLIKAGFHFKYTELKGAISSCIKG